MIRVRLQTGDGEIKDTWDEWGLIYAGSDNRVGAPLKEWAKTTYAEESGEHIDARTVEAAFDYTVRFVLVCPNGRMRNANTQIEKFNSALYETEAGTDVRRYKEVTFYNDYKRVRITGRAEPLTELKKLTRSMREDIAEVELKIRVTEPWKCDFAVKDHYGEYGRQDVEYGRWAYVFVGTSGAKVGLPYDKRLGLVTTEVSKGDILSINTKFLGLSSPLVIADKTDKTTVLDYIGPDTVTSPYVGEIESGYDGVLYVTVALDYLDEFKLTISGAAGGSSARVMDDNMNADGVVGAN